MKYVNDWSRVGKTKKKCREFSRLYVLTTKNKPFAAEDDFRVERNQNMQKSTRAVVLKVADTH
jgi:hypothetical protein